MELKAWTVHYFEMRRQFVASYCTLKRHNEYLVWYPLAINYNGTMDRDLQVVIKLAKNYDNSIPIIYMGNLTNYPQDSLFNEDTYRLALKELDLA